MPVKIRLQRHGKKGKPFYWIVAADSRSKRDGKFLEKLGTYNPNTNPATINVDVDGSVQWLNNGAQPTDTARAILSYKGVLLKHHLLGGVRKGALTEEQAEEKFQAWVSEKEKAVAAKVDGLDKAQADAKAKALEAEKEFSDKRAAAALPEVEEPTEEVIEESAPVVEEAAAEATETVEEVKEEVAEAPAQVKEEAPAETEAKAEEAAPEAPATEEEAPKE
ncbi:30S ribosomal protein S16 [uncultured Croceitalea sp.]|uniref:30S ribosomal protein S16 n=1 Tax=uncultured Croceitalea sp. TaxID=1798908 RepID=UPI00374E2154